MNTTFALGNGLKVIDLTKPLDPKTESRRCHLIRYNTGGPIPDFHTAMDLTSHLILCMETVLVIWLIRFLFTMNYGMLLIIIIMEGAYAIYTFTRPYRVFTSGRFK